MKFFQIEILRKFFSDASQKELPFRVAYKFYKIQDIINKDYSFFQEKTREIIFKYAERDENGEIIILEDENIKITPEKILEAKKAIEELNNIETENPNIFFTLEELENLEIKPSELQGLLPFIKEE